MITKSKTYPLWMTATAVFIICLIIFTWGLAPQEVIGFDSRFYLFALEMWRNGFSLFPTTYHEPYPDYPVTSTFAIYLFAKLFGTLNKFIAVLPSAIAAAITVAMTYMLGEKQHKRLGLYAVFFMLLTFTFLKSARSISLDMYAAMAAVGCVYLLRIGHRHWAYLFLIIGFLFRGPIGLVIPAGVVCMYYVVEKKWRSLFTFGLIALLLLFLLSLLLLFLAYHIGGETFVADVLRMQVMGRLNNYYLPRYFYFTDSLGSYALSLPLAWLVMIGMVKEGHSKDLRFLIQLLAWILIVLIGMSIPDDKKIRYILAITPAASLIAASLFVLPFKQNYFIYLRLFLIRLLAFFPLIFILIISAVYFYAKQHAWPLPIHFISVLIFLFILQMINFIFSIQHSTRILLIATISFVIAYLAVAEPVALYLDRGRDFILRIESMRVKSQVRLVFYKERPDGLPIKYLINVQDTTSPLFIESEKELVSFSQPAFFVTSADYFNELPKGLARRYQVIEKNSLGHTPVIVFTNHLLTRDKP